jgi:hypothetical protein
VRQVTGTLTINLSVANTGGNSASTNTVNFVLIEQEGQAATDAQVTAALGRGAQAVAQALASGQVAGDPANLAVLLNATTGAAMVVTGDAVAANASTVRVCQTFVVPTAVCTPAPVDPGTPTDPGGPGTPGPGAVTTPVVRLIPSTPVAVSRPTTTTQALPRTGNDVVPMVTLGLAFLAAGVALQVTARARRRVVAGRQGGSG